MHVIVGAFPPAAGGPAYCAPMNSYFSLTEAPVRSTRLLFSGRRSPSPAHGYGVPAHAAAPAPKAAAAAHHRHASGGTPAPNCQGWSHLFPVPAPHPRSAARFPPPSGLPLPGTQVRTSGISLTRDPVLSGEDPTFLPGLRPEGMAPSGQSG